MKLTVQDIYNFPEMNQMTLIAGRGGLSNEVRHCGILDYEYDKDVSSKYYDYNFYMDGGFLTLTSFLYAKNDPHLIYDAVKKLVAKKGSGLIIKNIFHLPISEHVIRYADRMNYPIFLLNDKPFFEDIIVLIHEKKQQYQSLFLRERKVDQLLELNGHGSGVSDSSEREVRQLIGEIHPSLQDDLVVAYFRHRSGQLTPEAYLKMEQKLYESGRMGPSDTVFYYRDGFLLIHSEHRHVSEEPQRLIQPYLAVMGTLNAAEGSEAIAVGVSKIHHVREDLAQAIQESIYAARFHEEGDCMAYEDLGVYRTILPFVGSSAMRDYLRDYIAPLEEYDSERSGEVLRTVVEFVQCGGDLERTAERLDQHKNTIRYRLKRAGEVLELNPFALGDYERLAMAVRIYICGRE